MIWLGFTIFENLQKKILLSAFLLVKELNQVFILTAVGRSKSEVLRFCCLVVESINFSEEFSGLHLFCGND